MVPRKLLCCWILCVPAPFVSAANPPGPVTVHSVENQIVIGDRGGEVIVVDAETRQLVGRHRVGSSLTYLQQVDELRFLASTSEELVLLRREQAGWRTDNKLSLPYVVHLAVHPERQVVAAAGLWSRRVTLLAIEEEDLRVIETVDLPFAPRSQVWLQDGKQLFVMDSFGGRFAILDATGKVLHLGKLPVHNARGLLADDRTGQLYISHQTMNPVATTERESVFWGEVIRSLYSRVSYGELVQRAEPDLQTVYPLSTPGDAAADPGPMVRLPNGGLAMALSGVGQLGLRLTADGVLLRRNVGFRPQGVAVNTKRAEVYVVSTLSNRLSVLELDKPESVQHIALAGKNALPDKVAGLGSVQRGERLFYNGRLSLDGWYSCHSCHTDGHSNGRTNDNLGDGDFGHPKRIPSLLGASESGPWGWDASKHQLNSQVSASVKNTMQGEEIDQRQASDLVDYLMTLQPPPGLDSAREKVDEPQVTLGARLFRSTGCADCHAPPTYTTEDVYDVDLQASGDGSKYNPPSLLGVSQRQNLFHDGRAASLDEVLKRFQHGQSNPLSDAERQALLAFLRSL